MAEIAYKTIGSVWYAMKASYGKALFAKKALELLNIENYVPIRYEKQKVKGRNVMVAFPAVANLIFVKTDIPNLELAKSKIDFLHNMLTKSEDGNSLVPIIVPEIDMVHFMALAAKVKEKAKFVDPVLNKLEISKGAKVRVTDGEFEGYEGVLCRPKGTREKRVLISIYGLPPLSLPVIDIELIEEI